MSDIPWDEMICPRCDGTGRVLDIGVHAVLLQQARRDAGVSLREMARGLGISPSYLCDIEHGRRIASTQRIRAWIWLREREETS